MCVVVVGVDGVAWFGHSCPFVNVPLPGCVMSSMGGDFAWRRSLNE